MAEEPRSTSRGALTTGTNSWSPRGRVKGCVLFFFQAEDGIRDLTVTGVQTCALPISHAQQELLQMKGLGEVVIAAGLQAPDPIHGIAACGEKQHRRVVALLAQRAAHAEAVDPRQHHIEHEERAAALAQPLERLLAIARGAHLVAFGAQVLHDAGGEVRIVLHHQHARARGGAHERCPCAAGQVSTKCAPWPTPSLCALTRPCPRCIRRCTMKSPRPVPYWLPGPRGCRRVNLSNS